MSQGGGGAPAAGWRAMDTAALDRAYDNLGAVPAGAATLQRHADAGAALRRRHPGLLDLAYGPRPRNRIDLFRCGDAGAPLLAFVHGGYWRRNGKEMFAGMAVGPMAHGFDVALIGYTLAPEASLTAIAGEIRDAIRFLRTAGPTHGVGGGRLVLAGWSAGAHLSAVHLALPEIDACLCVSGIFDLEPCRLATMNEDLRLTEREAAALSPIRHPPGRVLPVTIAYGTGELPELQRQSRDYHAALAAAGTPATLLPLEGENHFSILDQLARPDGRLATALPALEQDRFWPIRPKA
ncbi:alpha/beta hydrolase [Azospirillum sp. ST 5-10]|uniref:alpha/beta hydrolase n=1 Tax=unclassified Azospirillum TaxID=2630922 RepID=UPI003F4A7CED